MEKILKNISWILVVLLAASIIYALLAGQYPITSLGVAAVLLIVTAVRAVFGSLKKGGVARFDLRDGALVLSCGQG